jgi:hypothetical protein
MKIPKHLKILILALYVINVMIISCIIKAGKHYNINLSHVE